MHQTRRVVWATLAAMVMLGATSLSAQIPPSTGKAGADGLDNNFLIVSDNTSPADDTTRRNFPGFASIVTSRPPFWATPFNGTGWVAPEADQSIENRSPPQYYKGTTTYRTIFVDPKTTLSVSVLADDSVQVFLNGTKVATGPNPGYGQVSSFTLSSFNANNTMEFVVDNSTGASTGLDVMFSDAGSSSESFYPVISSPSRYVALASTDPIDGATGQFFDVFPDLRLGGPLSLGFSRYYGSQLSASGFTTSLGTNWMSNFDVGLKSAGTKAQVLLFTGTMVEFKKTGINWSLISPLDIPYVLQQSASSFTFSNPYTGTSYLFSAAGALTGVSDRAGNSLAIIPGPNGPTRASWGPYSLTFTYTGKQLTGVRDQSGREVRYGYTGPLLTSYTDLTGQVYKYSYTTAGKLTGLMTQKQYPLGETPATQTYDTAGRVVTQTDASSNATAFAYDGKIGTKITAPTGQVNTQASDSNGSVGLLTNPLGAVAKFAYDSSNRRTAITDRSGNTVSFTYDSVSGALASRKDPLGNSTGFTYTPQQQAGATFFTFTGIAHADGTKTSLVYSPQGDVTGVTRRDGSVVGYSYDQFGRVTSYTAPNNAMTLFSYNNDFTISSVQDALGNRTSFSYDANSRPSKIMDPNGSVEALTYDQRGAVKSFTDSTGSTLTTAYDADGRVSGITNWYGGTTVYSRTPDGKLSSYTDSLGNVRKFGYDTLLRPASFTNPLGQTLRFTRDAGGRLLSLSNDSGVRATYTYTPEGQLTSFKDSLARTWMYGIDPAGRRSSVTTPLGNKTAFTFDKLGRMSSVTDALGSVSSIQYDALGRTVQISLPGNLVTKIARNTLGLATAVTDPNGNVWPRSYDILGRIASRTDPLGNTTSYSYNGFRLSGSTTPMATLSVVSDAAGRITSRTYSDGTALNYSYDAAGRLISADGVSLKRDVAGQMTASNGIAVQRDPLGRVTGLQYADGKSITYLYSPSGKLSQMADWTGATTTFSYDAAGEMVAMQRPNGVASTYAYDADGRLTQLVTGSLASINLTRDATGKITSADRNLPVAPVVSDGSQSYTYDVASQLASATTDASGRVTAQDSRTYTWDGASRLRSFTDAGTPVSLTYDALGEIASLTNGGGTQNYVFDYALGLPALSIVQQAGTDLRYYAYLPDGRLLYSIEAADNSHKFYHFDETGNTAFLTDDSGKITDSYAITPYGEMVYHPGTSDNPFTFQGQYGVIQEASGLYYMRSRHYEAQTARFLSRDTVVVTDPRGITPYNYARGNPMLFNDPLGNGWFDGVANFVGGIGSAIVHGAQAAGSAVVNTATAAAQDVKNVFYPPETPVVEPVDYAPPDASTAEYVAPEQPYDNTVDSIPSSTDSSLANYGYASDTSLTSDASTYLIRASANAQQGMAASAADSAAQSCKAVGVVSNDGGTVVSNDGATVISNDGGTVISNDGGTLAVLQALALIGNDGGGLLKLKALGLIGNDGGSLTGNDGGSLTARLQALGLIGNDGGSLIARLQAIGLIGNDGGSVISNDGGSFKNGLPAIGLIGNDGAGLVGNSGGTFH